MLGFCNNAHKIDVKVFQFSAYHYSMASITFICTLVQYHQWELVSYMWYFCWGVYHWVLTYSTCINTMIQLHKRRWNEKVMQYTDTRHPLPSNIMMIPIIGGNLIALTLPEHIVMPKKMCMWLTWFLIQSENSRYQEQICNKIAPLPYCLKNQI